MQDRAANEVGQWETLMQEAKILGLRPEEVREFLISYREEKREQQNYYS
ncbi:hypothetical protein [Alkalicoccus halolimnae]|uniref:DNA-binding anti-repressor SinI n=1 Tax=Alkalicoccus halolimnae TaxID=1667239 RepID=A0AAJ8LST6_9BACI|nr:hypothetical protein [Alkalicoccus halolimnae]